MLVAAALVTGAVVLSRAQGEPEAAVPVAWMGAAYGAVGGLLFAPEGELLALPSRARAPVRLSRGWSASSGSARAGPS